MKQRILALIMVTIAAMAPESKAAIVVFNNMPCDVTILLYAHDASYPTLCALYKVPRVTIPGNGSWGPYSVANLNPDWYLPQPYPTLPLNINPAGASPTQFDGATVDYLGAFGGLVGNPAGCATTNNLSSVGIVGSGVCASTCNITWTQIGANIILSIDP